MSEDPGADVRAEAMNKIQGATSNESLPANPPTGTDSGDRNWVTAPEGMAPTLARDAVVTEAAGADDSLSVETDDGPPAQSALKAEWVEYAVDQGMPQDEAEAKTKADLIEDFGA
jgi:hypothetical protein